MAVLQKEVNFTEPDGVNKLWRSQTLNTLEGVTL